MVTAVCVGVQYMIPDEPSRAPQQTQSDPTFPGMCHRDEALGHQRTAEQPQSRVDEGIVIPPEDDAACTTRTGRRGRAAKGVSGWANDMGRLELPFWPVSHAEVSQAVSFAGIRGGRE